jgi:hypothetical protein
MHERVAACAIVGKPDTRLVELAVTFVQPLQGSGLTNPFRGTQNPRPE